MPEDGIEFAEYAFPRFIEDSTLGEFGKDFHKLITKYAAFPRIQEQLALWDDRFCQQIAAEVEWRRRREEHELWGITQSRWLDEAAGPTVPDCGFEGFRLIELPDEDEPDRGRAGPVLGVWFPPELCLHNCPEAELPLPPRQGAIQLCAKYAVFAAIHDYSMKGQRKLGDGLDLKHYDILVGLESPLPADNKHDGLIRQILANDKDYLSAWLDDIERDLQAWATEAAEQANDRPALARSAASAYEILLALPEHRAIKGPEMVSELYTKHKINIDESTFRKNVVPALKPYGLEHGPAGYRIQPDRRRP